MNAVTDVVADRAEIIELFGRYADIADLKDFGALPALVHTDPLTIDFSSVTGMPPMTVPLDDYREALRGSFGAFAATHHAITGHVVTIDGTARRSTPTSAPSTGCRRSSPATGPIAGWWSASTTTRQSARRTAGASAA
jgi:hypothetical protein